jgi:hypothetical protein
MLSIITILVGVAQNKGVKMVIKMTALIQFNGIKIVEEGSNTENKLVIIIFSPNVIFILGLIDDFILEKKILLEVKNKRIKNEKNKDVHIRGAI